jgi:uncharacterized protein (DUF1015 family)
MSDFRPFRALRFARDLAPRLAPPWDVISPDERTVLAAEAENIVHLTLPPGNSGERDYASASRTLADWIAGGVLVRDSAECLYVLRESTTDGRIRRGFIGLLRIADYDERIVLPHEKTMKRGVQDRLLLTREVRANLEPLFFLYEDRDAQLDACLDVACAGTQLAAAAGPDGTGLELFALDGAPELDAVRGFLADLPVVIADGHHRYETMRSYRDECRSQQSGAAADAGHEFVMGYLVNAFDPGSAVQAIHRELRGEIAPLDSVLTAAGFARQALAPLAAAELIERLAECAETQHAFVFGESGGALSLVTRDKGESLDVEVLHGELLPALGGELAFDARPARLLETLAHARAELGIFMNPTHPDDLFRVVRAGGVLPQKSTFFTPKIASGLLVRDL